MSDMTTTEKRQAANDISVLSAEARDELESAKRCVRSGDAARARTYAETAVRYADKALALIERSGTRTARSYRPSLRQLRNHAADLLRTFPQ